MAHRRQVPLRLVALLAMGALLAAAALWARSALGIEWSVESVRGLVDRMGIWGPIGFVALVACRTPLLLPSQLVLTVAGLCFGTLQGTVYGALGLLGSGLFAFGVTRWLGADAIRSRVPAGLRRTLEAGGTRAGAAIVSAATAYPVGPVSLIHAAAALTRMSLATFLVAVGLGGLVRSAAYAYFGSSLIEGRWLQAGAAAALLGVSLLPLLHPRVRGWLRRQFEAPPPSG